MVTKVAALHLSNEDMQYPEMKSVQTQKTPSLVYVLENPQLSGYCEDSYHRPADTLFSSTFP